MSVSEQRISPRVNVEIEGVIGRDVHPELSDMLMSNLSLGGCFIKTRMPEPPGSMVMLRFALPGEESGAVIKAVGRVCWVKSDFDGPGGMGIQFVRVDDADLDELQRYIAGLLDADLAEAAEAA